MSIPLPKTKFVFFPRCCAPALAPAPPIFPRTLFRKNNNNPPRSDSLWVELDRTGVKAVLIRICGGQHLDHITAYSADNAPVLELCRSDPRQVLVWPKLTPGPY